jgi:class 3 adenylate cyclase
MTMNNCNAQRHNDWNTLTPIGHDKNRFCGDCQRVVRLCTTETEKDLNHTIGRLVTFQPKGRLRKVVSFIDGQAVQKANDIEVNVYLLPEQTLSARQREEITMLFADGQQAEKILNTHNSGSLALLFRLELSQAKQLVEDLQGDLGIGVELEGEGAV